MDEHPGDWFIDWFDTIWYHQLYENRDYEEASHFLDGLVRYLAPDRQSYFLDFACGKGRHSAYLAAKGYQVTGVDLSQKSIQKAKQLETKNLNFQVHDIRQLYRANTFDFVLNLFTSFGYFERDVEHIQVLINMRNSLRLKNQKGRVVLDFLNAARVVNNLVVNELIVRDDIKFKIHRSIESGFVKKEIIVHAEENIHQFYEKVRLYQLADFELLFAQAGLKIVDIFGDYDLNPYDLNSERLILIAAPKNP